MMPGHLARSDAPTMATDRGLRMVPMGLNKSLLAICVPHRGAKGAARPGGALEPRLRVKLLADDRLGRRARHRGQDHGANGAQKTQIFHSSSAPRYLGCYDFSPISFISRTCRCIVPNHRPNDNGRGGEAGRLSGSHGLAPEQPLDEPQEPGNAHRRAEERQPPVRPEFFEGIDHLDLAGNDALEENL